MEVIEIDITLLSGKEINDLMKELNRRGLKYKAIDKLK